MGLANVFCNGPASKYFRRGGPQSLGSYVYEGGACVPIKLYLWALKVKSDQVFTCHEFSF